MRTHTDTCSPFTQAQTHASTYNMDDYTEQEYTQEERRKHRIKHTQGQGDKCGHTFPHTHTGKVRAQVKVCAFHVISFLLLESVVVIVNSTRQNNFSAERAA